MPRLSRPRLTREDGYVVWLTGLPGSGKSTIASRLKGILERRGCEVQVLDGDDLRKHPGFDTGFSREARVMHLQRVVYMCNLLANHGIVVIASFVSPYENVRAYARKQIRRFVEVYIKCRLEVCIKRDPKGLFKKALAGKIGDMTGIQDPYEEPHSAEVVVDTEYLSPAAATSKIVDKLIQLGLL